MISGSNPSPPESLSSFGSFACFLQNYFLFRIRRLERPLDEGRRRRTFDGWKDRGVAQHTDHSTATKRFEQPGMNTRRMCLLPSFCAISIMVSHPARSTNRIPEQSISILTSSREWRSGPRRASETQSSPQKAAGQKNRSIHPSLRHNLELVLCRLHGRLLPGAVHYLCDQSFPIAAC